MPIEFSQGICKYANIATTNIIKYIIGFPTFQDILLRAVSQIIGRG